MYLVHASIRSLASAAVLQSLKACLLTESISIIALVFTSTETVENVVKAGKQIKS